MIKTETTIIQPPPVQLAKISYRLSEAAEVTGITLNAIREAVSTHQLPSKKIGRSRIVLTKDLLEWINQQ